MANPGLALIYSVGFATFVAVFSILASVRGIPPGTYWAGVVGAVTPWLLATVAIVIASTQVPKALQQAAGMAGLFPLFGTFAILFVSSIASLILKSGLGWSWRMKWFAIVSGIPALLLTLGLLAVFINDSRK